MEANGNDIEILKINKKKKSSAEKKKKTTPKVPKKVNTKSDTNNISSENKLNLNNKKINQKNDYTIK